MWVVFKEVLLLLSGFTQRDPVHDLLLPSAPDDHVALGEVDDLVMDDGHHRLLGTSIQQVGLGQDPCCNRHTWTYMLSEGESPEN